MHLLDLYNINELSFLSEIQIYILNKKFWNHYDDNMISYIKQPRTSDYDFFEHVLLTHNILWMIYCSTLVNIYSIGQVVFWWFQTVCHVCRYNTDSYMNCFVELFTGYSWKSDIKIMITLLLKSSKCNGSKGYIYLTFWPRNNSIPSAVKTRKRTSNNEKLRWVVLEFYCHFGLPNWKP